MRSSVVNCSGVFYLCSTRSRTFYKHQINMWVVPPAIISWMVKLSLKDRLVEYVSRKYKEEGGGRIPFVREILREFNIHRVKLYSMFPGGLREICREARVRELDYAFKLRTENVKDEPYWRARREQLSRLCNWMLKKLRKAETSAELEAVAEDFRKLKMHYVRTVGHPTLSDRIEQQRETLAQLQRQRSQLEEQLKAMRERLRMPIEKALPVISELTSIKVRFGLSA